MTGTRVHTAPWVFTGERVVRRGAVAVTGAKISAVGTLDELRSAGEVVEWPGTLVPGLVNAHTHLQYTHMAALGQGTYASFEDWSEAFEAEYSRRDGWRTSAEDGLAAAISNGTTALGDVVTHAEALNVLADGRVHGIAYWEVMAWHDADWAVRGRQQTLDVLAQATGAIGLSPHAPYSLDTGVLDDLGRLARELGLRSHVHLAESAAEHEYVFQGAGALAEQWRDWGYGEFALLRGGGAAVRAVTYAGTRGVLGGHTHIAHGIYVDAEDRALLRSTGTVVALCPRSNAVLGLDAAPVAAYLREGNTIAVGTDSLSSSPSLDVLADVSALYRIARAQGYTAPDLHSRLFAAVTAGGAAAMGLDDRLGSLTAGKLADITVVGIEESTAADTLAAIVEAGQGSAEATIIDGAIRFARESALMSR
ncbi:amidohydrolase family protein [Mycolicibacterium fluoranthenivorans]|uniref:Cytosine/adenosine deaminase n=1 Tax=Mycolicibacterium fluoranthenivorans TaxID=258505 RepID=A0A1G4V7V3_9MYCO|nr:amidohydrolase family protein [Mycolicibacterium fluoranthenivorans]SCX02629.1 Cytosine/adenosine deaminase [Mycolicibacterium fluoranthenivorans]